MSDKAKGVKSVGKSRHAAQQPPLALVEMQKGEIRSQFAALCYREIDNKLQILLVTSRGRGRWILPKGWPIEGQTPGEAAMTEAWEEAGVLGKVTERCIGVFGYSKMIGQNDTLPCLALVYPVRVTSLAADFPEKSERRRKWFSRKKAAERVAEPELRQLLKSFNPKLL